MAHVRRKFVDIHRGRRSVIAYEVIQRIARFYAVETLDQAVTLLSRFNACFDETKRTDGPHVHFSFARKY
jgi:hypothetical protein